MQRDEVVNLHVCAPCQDSRWELTLDIGKSVACFRWTGIPGCAVEGRIGSLNTKETLASGQSGQVSVDRGWVSSRE